MNIRFDCPACERGARIEVPGPAEWQCPHCDHLLRRSEPAEGHRLGQCLICTNAELYRKKDFPHWLGMSILTVACVGFLALMAFHHLWMAWTVLIGSAVFDGVLYMWVGDVTVCYRCTAHFRGFAADESHRPHDLGIAERYRQERIRREKMEAEREK